MRERLALLNVAAGEAAKPARHIGRSFLICGFVSSLLWRGRFFDDTAQLAASLQAAMLLSRRLGRLEGILWVRFGRRGGRFFRLGLHKYGDWVASRDLFSISTKGDSTFKSQNAFQN